MSHPAWYYRHMIMNDKDKNELTFEGWHSDEKETISGWWNDDDGNDCRDHDQDAWNWGESNWILG